MAKTNFSFLKFTLKLDFFKLVEKEKKNTLSGEPGGLHIKKRKKSITALAPTYNDYVSNVLNENFNIC